MVQFCQPILGMDNSSILNYELQMIKTGTINILQVIQI